MAAGYQNGAEQELPSADLLRTTCGTTSIPQTWFSAGSTATSGVDGVSTNRHIVSRPHPRRETRVVKRQADAGLGCYTGALAPLSNSSAEVTKPYKGEPSARNPFPCYPPAPLNSPPTHQSAHDANPSNSPTQPTGQPTEPNMRLRNGTQTQAGPRLSDGASCKLQAPVSPAWAHAQTQDLVQPCRGLGQTLSETYVARQSLSPL